MSDKEDLGTNTLAIRAGQVRTHEGEHSEPIIATSSFVFENAAEAAARFSGDSPGNIYSRFTNPTVRTFEQRLAAMEGGERCIATSSGMSAILTTCLGLLKAGDQIVSSRAIFGTTVGLFDNVLPKFGITTTFVDLIDYDAWEAAISPETRLLFLETPSNPLTEIGDIAAISEIAHSVSKDIKVVVDNCFCTPILQRPLQLGADVVLHSATKFIDGQGRCVGGAIVGDAEFVGESVYGIMRTAGPSMSPFNAWVFAKGLETLAVRMERACDNAQLIAEWLSENSQVKQVYSNN